MPEFQSNNLHLSSSMDHPHHILPYCPVTPDTYLHSILQLQYPPLTILVQWNPLSVPNTCKTNTKTLQAESFLIKNLYEHFQTFRSHVGKSCSPIWSISRQWWRVGEFLVMWISRYLIFWWWFRVIYLTSINNHLIPLYKRSRPMSRTSSNCFHFLQWSKIVAVSQKMVVESQSKPKHSEHLNQESPEFNFPTGLPKMTLSAFKWEICPVLELWSLPAPCFEHCEWTNLLVAGVFRDERIDIVAKVSRIHRDAAQSSLCRN